MRADIKFFIAGEENSDGVPDPELLLELLLGGGVLVPLAAKQLVRDLDKAVLPCLFGVVGA